MQGVWLAQQMRSTFVGTISRTGSIDGLFDYLKQLSPVYRVPTMNSRGKRSSTVPSACSG